MGRFSASAARLLHFWGVRWVERRRRRHRDGAAPISPDALRVLAPFFPAETLELARVAIVPHLSLSRILVFARRLGISTLDVDRILGITYLDTIVVPARRVFDAGNPDAFADPLPLPTLFHELVHVEQARQLGLRAFVERYLHGWLEGGRNYGAIPLERDAYALERRFRAAPEEPFDVAVEVARQLTRV